MKPEKTKKLKGNEEILATAQKRLSLAMNADRDNHQNYVYDSTFSSSDDQWDAKVKRDRGAGRPALTVNRMDGIIEQIIGNYRQSKLSIKVRPAGGEATVETADMIAGLIRNIESQSRADEAYTNALECAARGGFGYFRILTEYCGDDVFDQDLRIVPIYNPLTVHFDPSAKRLTREDANWAFVTEMMPTDEYKRLYPKAKVVSFAALDSDYATEWCEGDDVRVAEYYEKVRYTARLVAFSNGMVVEVEDDAEIEALSQLGITVVREREAERVKVVWRRLSGVEILETREHKIRYIPIVPVMGKQVNIEGKTLTRSAIFFAKDPQRMLNYFKSVAAETVALAPRAPWIITPEQLQGFQDQWDNANSTPAPYMMYNHADGHAPPQRVAPPPQPLGEIALAMGSNDDIKATTTMHDASMGAQGNETSGKAILARAQQGNTANYVFVDNLQTGIEYCGRICLDWIPEVYDAERVIRTLDLEGKANNQVINERKYNPLTGITEILNSVTIGKYDLVMDTGPSFASRRAEGVEQLIKLAQVIPQVGQVAPDLIVEMVDSPGVQEVAERIRRSLPPQITTDPDSPEAEQAQAQAQQQQAEQQAMAKEMMQAKIGVEKGKIQAENAKSEATVVKAKADIVKANASVTQARINAMQPQQPNINA